MLLMSQAWKTEYVSRRKKRQKDVSLMRRIRRGRLKSGLIVIQSSEGRSKWEHQTSVASSQTRETSFNNKIYEQKLNLREIKPMPSP